MSYGSPNVIAPQEYSAEEIIVAVGDPTKILMINDHQLKQAQQGVVALQNQPLPPDLFKGRDEVALMFTHNRSSYRELKEVFEADIVIGALKNIGQETSQKQQSWFEALRARRTTLAALALLQTQVQNQN